MISRRFFVRSLPLLPASMASQFTSRRGRERTRVLQRNGRPMMIVVRGDDVNSMVRAALGRAPGLNGLLRGRRVVIKPNATASQAYPVTTDVALLGAVVRHAKEAGAARITICDSSSYAGLANYRVFSKLGYFRLASEEGVRATVTDSQVGSEYVRVTDPRWKRNPYIFTDRIVNEADFVINLAIPKRHHAADFSCALKNNFGCTYGTCRMIAHAQSEEYFDESVVEFADAVRPDLTIVDARSLLTRSGPAFRPGESEIMAAHQVAVSGDMAAADSYCGNLMEELDPTFRRSRRLQRQLDYAYLLGLGQPDLNQVEIIELTHS
jgi:uncharacterized protein (DUF362 family)